MKTIEELKEHFPNIEFSDKYMEILKYIREDNNAKLSIQGNAGSGKALPLDTIIPTPNGNVRFGDLKVGDYVFDRRGKPTKVVGVFPQGKLDLYKVILSDGRETYCNDEHLWTCYTSKGNFKTLTLREMINQGLIQETKLKNDGRIRCSSKFKIPTNECVEFDNPQKLSIDPYVIGAFIGNGCNLQKQLTISSNDEFTVKMCADLLGFDYKKNSDKNYNWCFYYKENDIRKTNKRIRPHTEEVFKDFLNEMCVYSHLKRIPNIYKYASKEDRLSLIQGLFDTDGSIGKNNRMNVSYSSTSLGLLKDIQEVLYSLGYASTISFSVRKNRIVKNQCYRLNVLVDNCEKYNFFRLPRKLERIKNNKKQRKYDRVGIRGIIPMNKKVEMMCIKVDNDEELFLTNDYIVTHNTTLLKIINYMFSDDVENKRMNIAIASSTGVASALLNNNSNIGATTIHSLFALKPTDIFGTFTNSYYKQKDLIANIDCFIIDEISMVSADLFDYIMQIIRVCRRSKPTRIILFGDCLQLQCVVKMEDPQVKDYYMTNYNGNVEFFSSFAFKDMGFATFLLTKIYRQNDTDDKFKDVLNRIRVCEQTQSDLDYLNQRVMSEEDYIMQNESFLRIVSTNKDVQKYNQIALDAIDGKFICLTAKITGTFRETAEFKNGFYAEKIWVKIGCPIMITRNAPINGEGTRDYYNGSMGTLVSCNDDFAIIDLGDREVRVERAVINNYEYELVEENGHTVVKSKIVGSYDNIPIKVCSASTIHKCQGLTLSHGYIDYGYWVPDNGLYVALSRFRSIKDFGLAKAIQAKDIHATQESLLYVKNNEYTESVYEEMFGKNN